MEDSEEDRVSEHRDTRHPHEIEEENKRSEKRESFLLRLEECGIQIEEVRVANDTFVNFWPVVHQKNWKKNALMLRTSDFPQQSCSFMLQMYVFGTIRTRDYFTVA